MKSRSSKEVVSLLRRNGWDYHSSVGSHCHFVHGKKPGNVTVPHPRKDIPLKTFQSILRQAGIELDER